MADGKRICKNADKLKNEFETYHNLCDEVALFFAPEKELLTQTQDGSEMVQPIDSYSISALDTLIRGLHSNSMSLDKGNIADADKNLMELPLVAEWYGAWSDVTEHHIEESDFINKFMQWLSDFCAFGASVMYVEFDPIKLKHHFLTYSIRDCYYTFDTKGEVDSVYRDYQLTARQAVREFGYEKVDSKIKKAFDEDDEITKFRFLHCFRERKDRDPTKIDSKNMPYESLHIFRDDATIVKESGTQQFRYVVKHFYQKTDEINGRSPCMQALPAARTLMNVNSDHYDGVELALLPPTWLPDRNAVQTAKLEAGSINYADFSKGQPWALNPDPRVLAYSADTIDRLHAQIDDLLFVDLFKAILERGSPQMTAYQTAEMVAERTQALAPIANTLSGFHRDVISLVAKDLREAGQVPPEPTPITETDMKVKYTSRLQVRLKQVEISATKEAIMQTAEENAALDQTPAADAVFKRIEIGVANAEAFGVPQKLYRNVDDAQERYDEILEAQQQAAQAETMGNQVAPVDLQKAPEQGSPMGMIEEAAGGMIAQ